MFNAVFCSPSFKDSQDRDSGEVSTLYMDIGFAEDLIERELPTLIQTGNKQFAMPVRSESLCKYR